MWSYHGSCYAEIVMQITVFRSKEKDPELLLGVQL